jgi:hypothetical protein
MIVRNSIVILRSNHADVGEMLATNIRKVMVLIVVTNVKSKPIERPIIAKCFLPLMHDIMLGDEMASNRVQSHTKKSSDDKVEKLTHSPNIYNAHVKDDDAGNIDEFPSGRFFGVDSQRTKGIEERL